MGASKGRNYLNLYINALHLTSFKLEFQEVFKVKHTELQKRRVEERELLKQIAATKRELIPLTTGAVVNIKRQRSAMLRKKVNNTLVVIFKWKLLLIEKFADSRQRQIH